MLLPLHQNNLLEGADGEVVTNVATITLVTHPAAIGYDGETEQFTGGHLSPAERQRIAALQEDEVLMKFVTEFLEKVA